MTDANDTKPLTPPAAAETAGEPRICEAIPSRENGISALASANAPFVFFDSVAFYGQADGVGSITLTALRGIAATQGQIASDRVITGHLRSSLVALHHLRDAIDGVLRLAQQQADLLKTGIDQQPPTMQ